MIKLKIPDYYQYLWPFRLPVCLLLEATSTALLRVLHSHAEELPWEPGKYQEEKLKDTVKCCAAITSCSWFVFECWIQEESLDAIVNTIAFVTLDLSVLHWAYSCRKGSWNGRARCSVSLLHCSMPSFICLYLCSKSLLGFGGKIFLFLPWMYT